MNIPSDLLRKKSTVPQILVRPMYRGDDLRVRGYQTVDFRPGVIIERAGKRYQIQRNGSQRKI